VLEALFTFSLIFVPLQHKTFWIIV